MKKTMTGSIRGTLTTWDGDRHGHNIIAADFGYTADKIQTVAPGGTYPAANLACSSCHDPHGKYRRFADGTISTTGLPIFGSGSYTNSAAPICRRFRGRRLPPPGRRRLPAQVTSPAPFAFVNPSPTQLLRLPTTAPPTTAARSRPRRLRLGHVRVVRQLPHRHA